MHDRNGPEQPPEDSQTTRDTTGRPGSSSAAGDEPTPTERPAAVETADESRVPAGGDGSGVKALIPGYEILGELGQGGMGIVYKARDLVLNRVVALKVVRRETSSRGLARFLAEAEAAAAVHHLNVVQVYEFGQSDGRPYLALEFCPGGTLADQLRADRAAHRRDPRAAAELVSRVAAGVAAAHAQGIVHRDLKPGNILFDQEGRPKVADFGLAKRGTGADLTVTGAVLGTPLYMSPEQAGGKAKFVGPPADVWALGVILYECLTGKRPFDADSANAVLARILLEEPATPRTAAPDVPRDLDLICRKCLEKDPAHRYPTAAELADDLRRFVAGESITVRPAGLLERGYRWARRKPTAAAACVLATLVLGLGAVTAVIGSFWRRAEAAGAEAAAARDQLGVEKRQAEDARDAERVAKLQAEDARRQADDAREDTAVLVYLRTVNLAHREWNEGNAARARQLLAACRPDLRGWEWHYLDRVCHPERLVIPAHRGPIYDTEFSRDGTRIVTAGLDGTVRVWDARTGAEVRAFPGHPSWPTAAAFTPDGTRVISGDGFGMVRIWEVGTGKQVGGFQTPGGMVRSVAVGDGGKRILTTGMDRAIAWTPEGKALVTFGVKTVGEHGKLWWDPAGRLIVTADHNLKTISGWNPETGKPRFTVPGHANGTHAVGFSADGARLVTAGADGTVAIRDTATGKVLRSLVGHTESLFTAEFSADGKRVVTAGWDKTARVWDAATGAQLVVLRGHTNVVYRARFSVDGGAVVTAGEDGTARVWDLRAAVNPVVLAGAGRQALTVAFSAGDGRLFTGHADGRVLTWDPRTGERVGAIAAHLRWAYGVVPLPGGKTLATGGTGGAVEVWDLATGTRARTLDRPRNPAVPDRDPLGGPNIPEVRWLAVDRTGTRLLAVRTDRTTTVWELSTGAQLYELKPPGTLVEAAAFSPDGSQLVGVCVNGTVRGWDAATGVERFSRPIDGAGNAVAFSPDGRLIAVGGKFGIARILRAADGEPVATLIGHRQWVTWVRFSPDGSRLVTADDDGRVKLWVARGWQEALTLRAHGGWARVAEFSPDGRTLATVGDDGFARLWDATPR